MTEIVHQTPSYDVRRIGDTDDYEITNLAGKPLRGPLPRGAAIEVAELYQGDDEADARQERLCAEMDR